MSNVSSDSSLFEGPEFSSSQDEVEPEVEQGHDEAPNRVSGGHAQAVLEHIARFIVDDPAAVVVEAGPNRGGVKLSLHVNPSDMGRIIGKRGRVAQALRTVVRAAGARDGSDASVDIVD